MLKLVYEIQKSVALQGCVAEVEEKIQKIVLKSQVKSKTPICYEAPKFHGSFMC